MFPKLSQLKSVADFRRRTAELAIDLAADDSILTAAQNSPLGQPLAVAGHNIGNRWCVHPMEGWDARPDGAPSELTLRRWRNFGTSGAKLVWGGEAAAVVPAGRANPRQLLATPDNRAGLAQLLSALRGAHRAEFGHDDDLLVALQLTHSGRFCRPTAAGPAPRIAFHHPLLDGRLGIEPGDSSVVLSDAELDRLIGAYVAAAGTAADVGFQMVDVKACHGYLIHELLSARDRPGKFGGDFAGRTRFLREVVGRIRQQFPALLVGVRLSLFDCPPVLASGQVAGALPAGAELPYRWGFGVDAQNPWAIDLAEPLRLVAALAEWGVAALNASAGSPYYSPHLARPAFFPPSDGYPPPEDPLVGVARQLAACRAATRVAPGLVVVASGFSYLQQFLPHVAQAALRAGDCHLVGLGRSMLSYPQLPADVLGGKTLERKRICRTFSDCTTAPRAGLVSGCYPLDPFYRHLPEADQLKHLKHVRQAPDG